MAARAKDFFSEKGVLSTTLPNDIDTVNLIGFASGMGARNSGCEDGPEMLKKMGLSRTLQNHGIQAKWKIFRKSYTHNLDENSLLHYLTWQYKMLAIDVAKSIRQQQKFVVIGGDHSCAIGTWSGAAHQINNYGELGLIWIDAHMDSHTFVTSHSGALHGMPLACLLGYGDYKLTKILSSKSKLKPENICLVGVRSYETEEAQLLERLGVRVIFTQELKKIGIKNAMKEALDIVNHGTVGFGISIDLDCIDPADAPGVGTPELDGITREELLDAIRMFPKQKDLLGIEVAELNPSLDHNQITMKLAIEAITMAFAKV